MASTASNKTPYPDYKPSGVEWLGEVPAHWAVRRLCTAVSILNGATPSTNEEKYWDGEVLWLTPEDLGALEHRGITDSRRRISKEGYSSCGASLAGPGSIALSTRAPIGHLGILESPGCTNQGCRLLVPRLNLEPAWLYWVLGAVRSELQSTGQGTTFAELSGSKLGDFRVPFPPFPEQAAIARFLDHATSRIDRYIYAKEELIALLEEQKRAIIHEAVTGQINVRTGRPYSTYRDPGVEWLDEIPRHWAIRRLGTVARVFSGSTPSRSQPAYWVEGTVPWLNSSKVNDRVVIKPSEYVTRRALQECSIAVVPRGAVIVGLVGQGRTRGLTALLGIDTTISQNLAAIVPTGSLTGSFLQYLLSAQYGHLRDLGRGGNQEALNCDLVGRLRVHIPSVVEQAAISGHLDRCLTTIRAARTRIDRQIALVKDYRARLINDSVTGKLDVREAAAGLDEKVTADGIGVRRANDDPSSLGTQPGIPMETTS